MSNNIENTIDIDNDGLSNEYDVIIQGTGLTESILACAISRSGRKVLHLDGNDYYGRNESTHSLDYLIKLCELHIETNSINIDSHENDPKVNDGVVSYKLRDKIKSNYRVISYKDLSANISTESISNEDTNISTKTTNILEYSRKFNIDFPSTSLLFSSGIAVDNLIKSNVNNYLEFQTIECLNYLQYDVNTNELVSYNVPCSKGDVFKSKLLTIIEKRILMKFLQAVVDWGRNNEGTNVLNLNELDLSLGRSLYRPQNKDINSNIFTNDQLDMKWNDFLLSYQLTDKLINIINYSLCLYNKPMDNLLVKDSLIDLYRHLISLGKFGESPFLTPLYGIGEISQAFCRMCAVWGGIYILRRGISSVSIDNNQITVIDDTDNLIKCQYLISSVDDWVDVKPINRYILTYHGVFSKPLLPLSRSLSIIPPNEIVGLNHDTVFIIQNDSTTYSSPDDYYNITIITEIVLLPDELNINHIRTIVNHINSTNIHEDFYCISIRYLYNNNDLAKPLVNNNICLPVYLVGNSSYSLSLHTYFQQAYDIFHQIYPNDDFLLAFNDVKSGLGDGNENYADIYEDIDEENDFRILESTLKSLNKNNNEENNESNNKTDN